MNQAQKLYQIITSGKAWGNLAERCCDFALDERLCDAYCQEKFPALAAAPDFAAGSPSL